MRQLHPQLPAAAHLAATGAGWNPQRKEYAGVRAACLGRSARGRASPSSPAAAAGRKRKAAAAGVGLNAAAQQPSRSARGAFPHVAASPALAPGAALNHKTLNPKPLQGPPRISLRKLQPLLAAALGVEAGTPGDAPPDTADGRAGSEPEEGELPPSVRPAASQAELRDLLRSITALRCAGLGF